MTFKFNIDVAEFHKKFETEYNLITEVDDELVELADKIISNQSEFITEFINLREDIIVEDEELTALTITFQKYYADELVSFLSEYNDNPPPKQTYSYVSSQTQEPQYIPKCPYCQSTNLSKISTASRAVSFSLFGFASGKVGKQWHCNNCKSDF